MFVIGEQKEGVYCSNYFLLENHLTLRKEKRGRKVHRKSSLMLFLDRIIVTFPMGKVTFYESVSPEITFGSIPSQFVNRIIRMWVSCSTTPAYHTH